MTTISCGLGEITFGPGMPTVIINDHLHTYGVENAGEDRLVVDNLKRGDFSLMIERAKKGLELLDSRIVDVGIDHPELYEPGILPGLVMAVHEATGVGMCLDTRNPVALRDTLEVYPHKIILNSIPCEEEQIHTLMPLAAEFHAAVILILTDEKGIPETVDERLRVAERLIKAAGDHGIPLDDIIIDTVVVAPATMENAMDTTLETLKAMRREFGCATLLGVSNAGYGMPTQGLLIQSYILASIAAGMDVFLASYEDPVMPFLFASKMAMDFLTGRDPFAKKFLNTYRADRSRFSFG